MFTHSLTTYQDRRLGTQYRATVYLNRQWWDGMDRQPRLRHRPPRRCGLPPPGARTLIHWHTGRMKQQRERSNG